MAQVTIPDELVEVLTVIANEHSYIAGRENAWAGKEPLTADRMAAWVVALFIADYMQSDFEEGGCSLAGFRAAEPEGLRWDEATWDAASVLQDFREERFVHDRSYCTP